ncbi:permease prefix domain 1-containing protein [Nocardia arthritidis]|uniref:Uncharacterized protein n=1 Tax=Nocardia arthritidis TaxID=228602 RepID=A0A6G9YRF4_9NOCA|nr:permease prefix domain 1-containing protein [Nocardia arthritidis]QIS15677.1 hypothetical protein F5544_39285 [Nocardia arthritidis]
MTIEDYLAELDRGLRGPARAKRRLLAEAAAGLEDAVTAYREAGVTDSRATALAVADFGPLDQIRSAFQQDIDIVTARRRALANMMAIPATVGAWKAAWELNPYHPQQVPLPAILIVLTLCLAAIVTFTTAMTTYLATGRLGHRRAWTGTVHALNLCTRGEAAALAVGIATLTLIAPRMFLWPFMFPIAIGTMAPLLLAQFRLARA